MIIGLVWGRRGRLNFWKPTWRREKQKLLEEVLEKISRFIEHGRGTRRTCRRLLRLFELLRRRWNRHFRWGRFAGIREYVGIRHRILQRFRRRTVATRNQIDDVLIGGRQSSDCWFLLGCWLFRALKIEGTRVFFLGNQFCVFGELAKEIFRVSEHWKAWKTREKFLANSTKIKFCDRKWSKMKRKCGNFLVWSTHLLKWPELGVEAGVDGLVGGVFSLIFLLKIRKRRFWGGWEKKKKVVNDDLRDTGQVLSWHF